MAATAELIEFDAGASVSNDDDYDTDNVNKTISKQIDAFLTALGKGEKLGLPVMVLAIEHMANHKNTTPASVLMAAFTARKLGEDRIFAGTINAFFGEKVVKGKADKTHPLGYRFDTTNFKRGVQPANTWAQVLDAVDAKLAFNGAKYKAILADMFAKEKTDPTEAERQAKILAALVKDAKKAAGEAMNLDLLVKALREAYANAA